MRSIINNVARIFCKAYSRIADDCIQRGLVVDNVAVVNSKSGQRKFEKIDFSLFKDKKFVPVINSLNPALTKAVVAQSLQQILTMALQSNNPEILSVVQIPEMVTELINSMNIDNPNLLRSPEEQQEWMQQNDLKTQLLGQYQQQQQAQQKNQKLQGQVVDSLKRKNMKQQLESMQPTNSPQ